MNEFDEKTVGLQDRTGALLMLDKNERKLLKELLVSALQSKSGRKRIAQHLGAEYVEIAERLLDVMGGS